MFLYIIFIREFFIDFFLNNLNCRYHLLFEY